MLGDGSQAALFRLDDGALQAVGNIDPFSGAAVLSRGIVGDRGRRAGVPTPIKEQAIASTTAAASMIRPSRCRCIPPASPTRARGSRALSLRPPESQGSDSRQRTRARRNRFAISRTSGCGPSGSVTMSAPVSPAGPEKGPPTTGTTPRPPVVSPSAHGGHRVGDPGLTGGREGQLNPGTDSRRQMSWSPAGRVGPPDRRCPRPP